MMPGGLLLTYYGDDFSGSTDVLVKPDLFRRSSPFLPGLQEARGVGFGRAAAAMPMHLPAIRRSRPCRCHRKEVPA
jgi:hypothetical protein